MARRLVAALAAGALAILLFCWTGSELGFTVVAVAFPFALMALGVAGRRGGRAALVVIAVTLLWLELCFAAMLALRGQVADGPWIAGLPAAMAWQLGGVLLLPLGVVALGFALTYPRLEVTADELERLRALAPEERE